MEVEGTRGTKIIWEKWKEAGRCAGEGRWFGWRQTERNGAGGESDRRIIEVSFISRKDERIVAASSSVEGSNEK